MRDGGRWVLAAIAVLAVVLVLGGGALLVADAQARASAAARLVDELEEFYSTEQGYQVGPRAPRLRAVITEAIVNDGPIPELYTDSDSGYLDARYGAFGVSSYFPVQRPWSLRLVTVPIAAGAALAIVVVLVRATAWRPRPERARSDESATV